MNPEETMEHVFECIALAGMSGDVKFFVPSLFNQPIRPGLPGCNWHTLRMN